MLHILTKKSCCSSSRWRWEVVSCHMFLLLMITVMSNDFSWSPKSSTQPNRGTEISRQWNPHAVSNTSCARFVLAELGAQGLGDQLEHYVYYLYIAKILEATLVVDGFVTGFTLNNKVHSGAAEYAWIAEHLLNIPTKLNASYIRSIYHPIEKKINYDEVVGAKRTEIEGRKAAAEYLPCNTMVTSSIYGCGGWCHLTRDFVGFVEIGWMLRQNQGYERCRRHYADNTTRAENQLHVVWHVRAGDICLHCDDIDYYRRIHSLLNQTLEGYDYRLTFEAQERVTVLEQEFPHAEFRIASKLVQTVCNFITADVLITAGSSFAPMAAMFGGAPWKPIVFESRMKEVPALKEKRVTFHYYKNNDAVLLDDGRPLRHRYEIISLLQSLLSSTRRQIKQKS